MKSFPLMLFLVPLGLVFFLGVCFAKGRDRKIAIVVVSAIAITRCAPPVSWLRCPARVVCSCGWSAPSLIVSINSPMDGHRRANICLLILAARVRRYGGYQTAFSRRRLLSKP
jgi:hypothetical protein